MGKVDFSAYTVLIAEDDAMSYKFLEVVLSKQTKINIIWAIDGQQAVEYCQLYKNIDLILMDLQLPVMDGFEAIKQIKKFRPDIPVIIQSANSMNDEWELSMTAGCDAFLTKPLNREILINHIETLLKPLVQKTA
jgi:CheY-like chemotaxis protein